MLQLFHKAYIKLITQAFLYERLLQYSTVQSRVQVTPTKRVLDGPSNLLRSNSAKLCL